MDGVRVMYSPETWAIDPVTRRWFPGYLPDESLWVKSQGGWIINWATHSMAS